MKKTLRDACMLFALVYKTTAGYAGPVVSYALGLGRRALYLEKWFSIQ